MFEAIAKLFNRNDQSKYEGMTVLIVEDSDIDLKITEKIVSKMGFRIEVARNGEDGLKKAIEIMPQLIIMDCDMPKMSGVETCRKIKNLDETKSIPVLFLTSNDTPTNILDCFEVDAINYLNKPISSKALTLQIKTALEEASMMKKS